jgi:hypothetical protein
MTVGFMTAAALAPLQAQSSNASPTLLFTTNQACTLHVDGVSRGTLDLGGVDTVHVQMGQHLITCTSADGLDTVESDVTVSAPVQSIVKLDLKSIADARVRKQAAAQRALLAQQQRDAINHQFDGLDANGLQAWIARFAEQHLQLYVNNNDADTEQVAVYSNAVSWPDPPSCSRVTQNGDSTNYYSNCVDQFPVANLVSITFSNAGVFLSGRFQVCYHLATVTETTTNRPFIGETTSSHQYDSNSCSNWISQEFKITAGDKDITRADYQNLALAFHRLAVLQNADLRN